MDKISSTKTNKRSWFGKDRKTCFISCVPNDRYFNGKLKEVQETFLKESKEYLEQYDPVLLCSIQNQPLPKRVKTTSKPKEEKTLKEDNELDRYQKEREQKRKEDLVKRTQISVAKPFSFSETGKKDPCRGMRWVNPFESINQTRLGHSQSWRGNKSKKEFY
jgi:hypothetical protein